MSNAATQTSKSNGADGASQPSSIVDDLVSSIGGDFLKGKVEDLTKEAKKQGFMTIFKTREFVQKNPFQSLAIAFGVGYVLKTLKPGVLITGALVGGALYGGKKIGLQ